MRRVRGALQWATLGAAWVLFVLAWIRVFGNTSSATMVWSVVVIGSCLLLVATVTTWWIKHNLAIYRKSGPRRALPEVLSLPGSDFLGRPMEADWSEIRSAPLVEVTLEGDDKAFRAGSPWAP